MRRMILFLVLFIAGCISTPPPGYHYESGNPKPVSDDICERTASTINFVTLLNFSRGASDGIPHKIVGIKDIESSSPKNSADSSTLECEATLIFKAKYPEETGYVTLSKPYFPLYSSISVQWETRQDHVKRVAAEMAQKNKRESQIRQKIATNAESEDTASTVHIPSHCLSKQAIQYERSTIPSILETDPNIRILSIKPLADTRRLQYWSAIPPRPHYYLSCPLKVKWNNGNIDFGYWFTMWREPNGQVMVYYGHREYIPGSGTATPGNYQGYGN